MEGDQRPPVSDGSGRDRDHRPEGSRANFRTRVLRGRGGALADAAGASAGFRDAGQEPPKRSGWRLPTPHSLARIGVSARVRLVDEAQFQRRRGRFDFDMIIGSWVATPSPAAEQRGRWESSSADVEGVV